MLSIALFPIALFALIAVAGSTAQAQDGEYIDDRSGPATVVRSLYNAINRRAYARAWSYFAEPPAADLETYAAGYADTWNVELLTGYANEEAAAGSIYYQIPVAIRATSGDGSKTVYAGCYRLRMTDPAVSEVFEPLAIERGSLRPSDAPLERALPRRCGDGPDVPEFDAAAVKAGQTVLSMKQCEAAANPHASTPQVHDIVFRYAYDDPRAPERTTRLLRFLCDRGAYNESHVYFLLDEDGEPSLLHFAEPELDIRYKDEDRKVLESITVTGFTTRTHLVNSVFDPQSRTIEEFVKWRGLGDAASSAEWSFRHGRFSLVRFAVDPTYDEAHDYEIVVDQDVTP